MRRRAVDHNALLITGANGFSGRRLTTVVRRETPQTRIIGLDVVSADDADVDEQLVIDLLDVAAVRRALAEHRPASIIHLAGRTPPADEREMWLANVAGTFNLLEAVRSEQPDARVLIIGSAAEYGPPLEDGPLSEAHPCKPTTGYGRTKLAQTVLALDFHARLGLNTLVARPFNLFGPGMPPFTVAGQICSQIARAQDDRTLRLGNLLSARDFVDIRTAVDAYWRIVRDGAPGQVYNVCTGRPITIRQLVDAAIKADGREFTIESVPERFQKGDVDRSFGDGSKLRAEIGVLNVIPLEESLRDTLAWFKQHDA